MWDHIFMDDDAVREWLGYHVKTTTDGLGKTCITVCRKYRETVNRWFRKPVVTEHYCTDMTFWDFTISHSRTALFDTVEDAKKAIDDTIEANRLAAIRSKLTVTYEKHP
jgi:hypothetical protein